MTLTVIQLVLVFLHSVADVVFGVSLLRNRRRHAALYAYLLVLLNIVIGIITIMLLGFKGHVADPLIRIAILLVIASTVDPSLRRERELASSSATRSWSARRPPARSDGPRTVADSLR